jgi:two-component system chemotaxis sensor kinase CheA
VTIKLPETDDAFELRLQAIFAAEARAHLVRIDAGLAALAGAGGVALAAPLAAIRDALHTLKGAARSLGLGELEYLCHALENVIAAAAGGAALAPAQLARIAPAVALAGLLLAPPPGRIRNQAMALIGQLDALARELAAARQSLATLPPKSEDQ